MEKTMTVKPYDHDVIDELTTILLWKDMKDRGDGLMDIPAATLQLGINILESAKYYVSDLTEDLNKRASIRETMGKAISIMEHLRDVQKTREHKRKVEENRKKVE